MGLCRHCHDYYPPDYETGYDEDGYCGRHPCQDARQREEDEIAHEDALSRAQDSHDDYMDEREAE